MLEPLDATAENLVRELTCTGGFVEAGLTATPRLVAAVTAGGLGVLTTTRAAHALPVASRLTTSATAKWPLSEDGRRRLDIVLHEAIANAVLHGNLAIGTTSSLAERFDRIDACLADPTRAALPVEVTLLPCPGGVVVTVCDAGGGFDLAAALGRIASVEAQSGRGLELIRAVALTLATEDGGRTLRVTLAN
jgi:anti-sigma regulatory factor (Ser/Thr protein kinase)